MPARKTTSATHRGARVRESPDGGLGIADPAKLLSIRPAVEPDAEEISALIYSQLHHRAPSTSEPAPAEFLAGFAPPTIREHIGNRRYRYLVALAGGQVVGVLGVRDGQHLLHLFVAESFQRRGIARALWNRIRLELLAGSGEVSLSVNSSVHAVSVYERFGFTAAGPQVQGAGVVYIPMRLTLRDSHR